MDVGWSRLSDMNVHEGKLLGCSYNQNCVGVWVVDLSVFALSLHYFKILLFKFSLLVPHSFSDNIASALSQAILEILLSQMDKQRKGLDQEEIQ